jgi:uncharacterized protein (TIGR00369 family)
MERSRTYTWEDPAIGATKGSRLSGIEYLQSMQMGTIPPPPILGTLDLKIKSVEKGKAVFSFVPQEFHYNPIGSVHGGVITAILDSAMGCSLHSTLPEGKGYTTLELKVNFLKGVTQQSGELTAIGKIIHSGTRTALVEAQLINQEGKVFAHGISTCLIIE